MKNEYTEKVDKMEEIIIDALGYRDAFTELSKALSYAAKEEMYDYIIRMHDLEGVEE